ncbi:MAG: glycine zipper 2TM domain-containing protein [bacterium]
MRHIDFPSRQLIALASLLAMGVGCRDKAPSPADSSLAQDLALAQRPGVAPTVFNDAPIGGVAPASKAPAAATRKPAPPRATAPTPRPSPRREAPPAPVSKTPERTPPQAVATAPATAPTTAPAPAAATEPAPGIIGTGTRVGMTTNARICANTLLPGDKLSATVTSGATGSNGAAIASGSTVVLEVASVDKADPIEASRIEFRVRAIDVNGDAIPATGDIATLGALEKVQTSSGNDAKKVAGGAIAGAVLGRIFGGSTKSTVIGAAAGAAAGTVAAKRSQNTDACLPLGSQLRLTLSRDMIVKRSGAI